jgi:hypothetical protein
MVLLPPRSARLFAHWQNETLFARPAQAEQQSPELPTTKLHVKSQTNRYAEPCRKPSRMLSRADSRAGCYAEPD